MEDILYAWRRGWTGKGVNVMIEDGIKDDHGVVTALIAYRYAPGANYYGLDVIPTLFTNNVFDQQLGKYPSSYTSTVNVGVVNASYTADLKSMLGDKPWTEASLLDARVKLASSAPVVVNRFKDAPVSGQLAQFKYADAVITKAAGNDSILAEYEPLNWFLAKDSVVNERLLIVGALNKAGSVDAPADKASYSNTAGNDSDVSSRFLLASGTIPFGYRSVAIDSVPTELLHGTSFAAPRVAGYVAILRSKFPNLSGKQSASIMLDTAGYETLSCNTQLGGCDPQILWQG
ncbi:MAG: S8 family serine peptidase [Limnohabitans sp.]